MVGSTRVIIREGMVVAVIDAAGWCVSQVSDQRWSVVVAVIDAGGWFVPRSISCSWVTVSLLEVCQCGTGWLIGGLSV